MGKDESYLPSGELLTPEEAATYLTMHVDSVRRLLRSGKLPGKKIGGGWRISKSALDKGGERSTVAKRAAAAIAKVRSAKAKENSAFQGDIEQMTKVEETFSQRYERRIRQGCDRVIDKAFHPRRIGNVAPLSVERLGAIDEGDRILLAVCADALQIGREQEFTPIEDVLGMILNAYGRGEVWSEWEEVKELTGRVVDYIAVARLMLVQFPEQVLGPFADEQATV